VTPDWRRSRSLSLAWRLYAAELRRGRRWSAPALLLPAVGKIAIFYVPPLLLGGLVARLAAGAPPDAGTVTPYVLGFAGAYFIGDALIRAGDFCLNRTAAHGTARLYVDGLDALLGKDAAFFADSLAGALTKKSSATPAATASWSTPSRSRSWPTSYRCCSRASCCGATTLDWCWCCSG